MAATCRNIGIAISERKTSYSRAASSVRARRSEDACLARLMVSRTCLLTSEISIVCPAAREPASNRRSFAQRAYFGRAQPEILLQHSICMLSESGRRLSDRSGGLRKFDRQAE